jgi:tetratricopeptide (TPR) repeat protein
MYLRTPKRYRVGKRPRRHLFSGRRLLLWFTLALTIGAGVYIVQRQDELGPPVREFVAGVVEQAQGGIATLTAPTPPPTEDPTTRLVRADEAWSRGAVEDAVTEYQALADALPNDARVHYRVVLGLIMQGRADDAVQAAEVALTASPFSADIWAVRAQALERSGEYAQAVASALQALSIDPRNARAMAFMGEAYMDAGRADLAQESINRALDASPDGYEANYVDALMQWQVLYNTDLAADRFTAAFEAAPNLPSVAVDRAWFEWGQQNYDVALELLTNVLELNPQNLDALYAIAFLYYQAYGDPNQSLDYLERCVQADAQNAACLAYLGTVQTALGNTQAALQTYRRLMNTDTQDPRHFLAAGRAYMNSGDCTSAVVVLERGYALEQDRAEPNDDRLALFEEYLLNCGAPVTPLFLTPEATEEATPEAGA